MRRERGTDRSARRCPAESAREALAGLREGLGLTILTKGQFSLLDAVSAALDWTGPADVTISTWTTGIRDARQAAILLDKGRIRSLRLLVDGSFVTRQPWYAEELLGLFGEDAIRCVENHAKFAAILGDGRFVAMRGSLNLNRNPRWENLDVDCDEALARWFAEAADEIWRLSGTPYPARRMDSKLLLRESMGGEFAADAYAGGLESESSDLGDLDAFLRDALGP